MAKLVRTSELKAHPKLGPGGTLIRSLSNEEYSGLVDSVRRHGVMQQIVVSWPDRVILDGHHRWRAAKEVGLHEVPVMTVEVGDDAAHVSLGMSLNKDRRHLTNAEKRGAVEAKLAEEPELSDRAIAVDLGVSPTLVGRVRAEAQVSTVDTCEEPEPVVRPAPRTGRDGKKYRPVSARKPKPKPEPVESVTTGNTRPAPEPVEDVAHGQHSEPEPEPVAEPESAPEPPPLNPFAFQSRAEFRSALSALPVARSSADVACEIGEDFGFGDVARIRWARDLLGHLLADIMRRPDAA